MRQIAQNKQHHWHFSPMTLPYSFSNASNKQQATSMENTEQGDTHNLSNSNLPQTFNVLPPFPLTWFEPRLRIYKRTFDVALVDSVLFSCCCAWKKFTFNFTINKKRDRIKDTMSFAGFKKQINKANQVRKGMKKDEALTRLFDRHHNVSLSPHNSCEFDFHLMWQFMSEKIGGAKGSTLEEDFVELERVSFFLFFWFCFEVSIPHMFTLSPLRCSCIRTCELHLLF